MAQQADKSKIEQIVMQLFAKSLHIILESRIPFLCSSQKKKDSTDSSAPSLSSLEQRATKGCWFNLSLGDCPLSVEDLGSARRILLDSMAIDVLLLDSKSAGLNVPGTAKLPFKQTHEHNAPSRLTLFPSGAEAEENSAQGTLPGSVVERWVLQFDGYNDASISGGPASKGIPASRGCSITPANTESLGIGGINEYFERGTKRGIFGSHGRKAGDLLSSGGIGIPSTQLPKHVLELPALYKRMVIMLRSLYAGARLLPAYKLFRLASSSSHSGRFSLSYNVSSPPVPLPEAKWTGMTPYCFTPVETHYGRLCLFVAYQHTTAFTSLEVIPPILSNVITDYVGSPAIEPSKKFLTDRYGLPESRRTEKQVRYIASLPSSVPSTPSSPSFARRHSWSGAGNKMQAIQRLSPCSTYSSNWSPSPSSLPSIVPRPSPSYKRLYSGQVLLSRGSPSNECTPSSMPTYVYSKQKYSQLFDNQGCSSPSFSSSSSPSPPMSSYRKSEGAVKEFRQSAPLSIPKPLLPRSPKLQTTDLQQVSRSPLLPPTPLPARSQKSETLPRAFSANSRLTGKLLPSGLLLDCKLSESLSALQINTPNQDFHHRKTGFKTFQAYKNLGDCSRKDSGNYVAVEEDFSLPFVSDDDDTVGQQYRVDIPSSKEIYNPSSGVTDQRSQDAAVGYLIRTLSKASPLRSFTVDAALDIPTLHYEAANISSSPVVSNSLCKLNILDTQPTPGMLSSYSRKTAIDALQELQIYKEIGNSLQSK